MSGRLAIGLFFTGVALVTAGLVLVWLPLALMFIGGTAALIALAEVYG